MLDAPTSTRRLPESCTRVTLEAPPACPSERTHEPKAALDTQVADISAGCTADGEKRIRAKGARRAVNERPLPRKGAFEIVF